MIKIKQRQKQRILRLIRREYVKERCFIQAVFAKEDSIKKINTLDTFYTSINRNIREMKP